MTADIKSRMLRYGITTLIGLAIAAGVAFLQGISGAESSVEMYRILCDACFVSAMLLICSGLMIWVSNLGTFLIVNYGFKSLFSMYSRDKEKRNPEGSFFDYQQKRMARKTPFLFIVIVGCFFLIGACIFNVLFMSAWQ